MSKPENRKPVNPFQSAFSRLSFDPGFRKRVKLFPHHRQPSAFPHLLGFSGLTSGEAYTEKITLISASRDYLLRILQDHLKDRLEAHLLHPEPRKYQHAFIILENLKREFLTDSHGRTDLGPLELDQAILSVYVCPPSAVFEITPSGEAIKLYAEKRLETCSLESEFFQADRQLVVKIKLLNLPETVEIKRALLVVDDRETLTGQPWKNLIIFETPLLNVNSLKICLYE